MYNTLILIFIAILFIANLIFVGFLVKEFRTFEIKSTFSKIGITALIIIWLIMTNYIIFMPLWGGILQKG